MTCGWVGIVYDNNLNIVLVAKPDNFVELDDPALINNNTMIKVLQSTYDRIDDLQKLIPSWVLL